MRSLFISLLLGAFAVASAQTPASEQPSDTLSTPGYEELDELVIEATVPVMKTDGAKLTYNVDEDPAAESSNVLEILRKVPQVTVDGEGNIRLNGSDAFKIQVNGLENPMYKQYAGQIFQAMPAASVVRIEVITEPGAKEDAEGSAGIINIITERSRSKDGYNGNMSLRVDNRSLTPSLFGTLKKGNVTLSANLNYQWGFAPMEIEQRSVNTYLTDSNPGYMQSGINQKTKHQYVGGNLNMSWEPNPDNLFTMGADITYMGADLYDLEGFTSRFDNAGNMLWSFRQSGNGNFKMTSLSANASYRHNFGRDGNRIVLSYLFNFGRNNLLLGRQYFDMENYFTPYTFEDDRNKTFNRGHTVQADYANDFGGKHHLLEAGVKGIFRRNTALSNYYYATADAASDLIPGRASNILQPQDIYAAYASYTGNFGAIGVVGGLRYEHTWMGVTDRTNPADNFRNRLNDWVPNAALTWNVSSNSTLRLAYQMRISRPSIDQVNPFMLSFSPFEVRMGNPDLTSERNHIVSLKYSAFGRVIGGSVGLEYNLSDNAISSYTYLMDQGGINTVVTSFANIGKKQDVALTGFLNWSIISQMNLTLNGRLAYNSLKAPAEGYRNHGWSGTIGGMWNYTVADVNKFSVYGAWISKSITVQGHRSGFHYYGVSASRDFLSDRSLTLSVSANNFLQKKLSFGDYSVSKDVIYDNRMASLTAWNVAVSVTWKFGSLNTRVKQTGVEINNDDINKASNSNQASPL